jgi:hypothetical protein
LVYKFGEFSFAGTDKCGEALDFEADQLPEKTMMELRRHLQGPWKIDDVAVPSSSHPHEPHLV